MVALTSGAGQKLKYSGSIGYEYNKSKWKHLDTH